MRLKVLSSIIAIACLSTVVNAQLLYNRGQLIFSRDSALIKVEGTVFIDRQGRLDHNGSIYIDGSFHNAAVTEGDGRYYVYKDWINDSSFTSDSSHVYLYGANQLITGDSVSRFFDLTLQGTGIKTQTINARTKDLLTLNNLELALGNDTMFVDNPDTGAVRYDNTFAAEGFVSMEASGLLVRRTNQVTSYFYPLGSSQGIKRFRPVAVNPLGAGSNSYGAALLNYDANADGYSRSMLDSSFCLINGLYYHTVDRVTGGDNADITFYYEQTGDGYWDGIGNWKGSVARWENIVSDAVGGGSYQSVTKLSWGDFTDKPYILMREVPREPVITGDSVVCSFVPVLYQVPDSSNITYFWTVTGGSIVSGQSTNTIDINWGSTGGVVITIMITDTVTGCTTISADSSIWISDVEAGFSASTYAPFPFSNVSFTDTSKNEIMWDWDLGDGGSSGEENPVTQYVEPGTYEVVLIVEDQYGCTDTAYGEIIVSDSCMIPNVFTPDNDGINDVFEMLTGCVLNYEMKIFNRWGQLMYEGIKGSPFWDGYALNGGECSEGTYFYVFRGETGGEAMVKNGYITLLR